MVLLLSPKYMSAKFSGFLVALKNEMPYFRAFPGFVDYSSSSAFIWKPFANAYNALSFIPTNPNLPLFVSYAQIAIAKVPTTIRINPASAFLLNFSLNTK